MYAKFFLKYVFVKQIFFMYFSNSRPVPFESIVTCHITVSSIFCSKSVVDIKQCFTQPICFYSVFAGPVSSRKSTCISLFKDTYDNAVNIINKYNDPENKACLQAYSNCSRKKHNYLNLILIKLFL